MKVPNFMPREGSRTASAAVPDHPVDTEPLTRNTMQLVAQPVGRIVLTRFYAKSPWVSSGPPPARVPSL